MEMMEFVSKDGIIRFDGTILELLGFNYIYDSLRIHINHIKKLEKKKWVKGRVYLIIEYEKGRSPSWGHSFYPEEEFIVDELIAVIQQAEPNLEVKGAD